MADAARAWERYGLCGVSPLRQQERNAEGAENAEKIHEVIATLFSSASSAFLSFSQRFGL
jgi:hypothetical protein